MLTIKAVFLSDKKRNRSDNRPIITDKYIKPKNIKIFIGKEKLCGLMEIKLPILPKSNNIINI